ncbi:MAG: MarR family transcriptional regulator [Pseudomonadota bacterium]
MTMDASNDIAQILDRLSRVLQNEGHAEGLKPAQWEALRYLSRANRFSRTPSALTAYLGITKGTVSQSLNALERKGLIKKTADPGDRRQVRMDLTAKGTRLLARDPLTATTEAASSLSAAERQAVATGLEELLRRILLERDGRAFGVCRTCRYFRKNDPNGAPHRCDLLDEKLSANDSERICLEQELAA